MTTSPYKGKRVVILGSSGFIGRWVAKALTDQGAELFLPVRNLFAGSRVVQDYLITGTLYELDLRNTQALRKLFSKAKPAITFNLAGYGVDPQERDEQAAYETNSELLRAVCEAQSEYGDTSWTGQQLINVGSALEYGDASNDLSEDSDAHPTTLYGRSKLAGTNLVKSFCNEGNLRALTARLFTVYGPGEHDGRLLPSLMKATHSSSALDLTAGLQQRDFTFVGDVVEGLLRLGGLDRESSGEIVNLATGQLTSVRMFAETAAGILGLQTEKLRFGKLSVRSEEMRHSEVNLNRLRELTSWQPGIAIPDGIRQTLEFNQALTSLKGRQGQIDIALQPR